MSKGIEKKQHSLKYECQGPDSGALSNTKRWRDTSVSISRSPYLAHGDLGKKKLKVSLKEQLTEKNPCAGFITQGNKQYGLFFLAVNSFNNKIFVLPIKSTKKKDILGAIALFLKVNLFRNYSLNPTNFYLCC